VLGLSVGGVLAPGLPGTSWQSSMDDARTAAQQWSSARLHPLLVLAGSELRERHARGRYHALELGEAITICRDMMDVLEPAGVVVTRVGLQPGPDGMGRAVAGPRHSGLRQLVEARRSLDGMRVRLRSEGIGAGDRVRVHCAPADETRTRGPYNQHIRTLRAEFGLTELTIHTDPTLTRGTIRIQRETP
jgi:histone acetyltransferase (RNA polymerase elongator complex component)